MIAADVSLSSIATSNSARAAYGWRVLEEMLGGIYFGPEFQYFGSNGYRHSRLGMHVTSMKTEDSDGPLLPAGPEILPEFEPLCALGHSETAVT